MKFRNRITSANHLSGKMKENLISNPSYKMLIGENRFAMNHTPS